MGGWVWLVGWMGVDGWMGGYGWLVDWLVGWMVGWMDWIIGVEVYGVVMGGPMGWMVPSLMAR